jgi:hypothetical protein
MRCVILIAVVSRLLVLATHQLTLNAVRENHERVVAAEKRCVLEAIQYAHVLRQGTAHSEGVTSTSFYGESVERVKETPLPNW